MNYEQADSKLQGRCRDSRKIGNHTYLLRRDGHIAVRLHATDVVRLYPNGDVQLRTGGYETKTTKDRITDHIPAGWAIGSDSKTYGQNWIVYNHTPKYWTPVAIFCSGMTIKADGTLDGVDSIEEAKEAQAIINRERSRARYWISKARRHGTSKRLKLETIMDEDNVSIRMAMAHVYGLDRFLIDAKAETVDRHEEYSLLNFQLGSRWQRIVALKMTCPSTSVVYISPIDPGIQTVAQALDWMYQTDDYLGTLAAES